jgi:hypothetical protein
MERFVGGTLRDNIHPDETGQRVIATTVLDDMRTGILWT